MSDKPDLAERIGSAINELDIDFSRFTFVGWLVSLVSLGAGGGTAYLACHAMIRRNGLNVSAGMVFCLTMIAVTTCVFLALRRAFGVAGFAVSTPTSVLSDGNNAGRDALQRMAKAGLDMNAVHAIDFRYLFSTKDDAEAMRRVARRQSFRVTSIESDDTSGAYEVKVRVELVPTPAAVTRTEQVLGRIAEQCNGYADGWGVRQRS